MTAIMPLPKTIYLFYWTAPEAALLLALKAVEGVFHRHSELAKNPFLHHPREPPVSRVSPAGSVTGGIE